MGISHLKNNLPFLYIKSEENVCRVTDELWSQYSLYVTY
jgi:hypothetical protein